MPNQKKLNVWLRVSTGIVLSLAGAVLLTSVGGFQVPVVTRDLPEMSVSTSGSAVKTVVCQGPMTVFGLDSKHPNEASAIGSTRTLESPKDAKRIALETNEDSAEKPFALQVVGETYLAAAVNQKISSGNFYGQTAFSCAEPLSDQWIVGSDTLIGTSTSISISNPGLVPATVKLTLFDSTGNSEGINEAGILVPPASQRQVSLNGFGGGREAIALRIESSGAPVSVVAGIVQTRDLSPTGSDQINSQVTPSKQLIFAGVKNYAEHTHAVENEHGEEADEFPVVLRLLSPTEDGSARVIGVTSSGERSELGVVTFEGGIVSETPIVHTPENVNAVIVESDTPVVGGLLTSTHLNNDHDFTWMSPSSVFEADESAEVLVFNEGKVTFVNVSEKEAVISIAGKPGVKVAPHVALIIETTGNASVTSSEPFALGVTLFDKKTIASYPALRPSEAPGEIRIYPR